MQIQDFPGGPVVKNLPANRGDMGSITGPEIPHATEQQSLSATTTDSLHPKAHTLKQEKPEQWKACAPQLMSSPHSPQLKKAHMQQWTPSTAKNSFINFFLKKNAISILSPGDPINLGDHYRTQKREEMWPRGKSHPSPPCHLYSTPGKGRK